MRNALILVFSNLKHDARVMRQINFLSKRFTLTICCYAIEPNPDYKVIKLTGGKLTFFTRALSAVLLLLKRYTWAHGVLYPFKNLLKTQLSDANFDLIIANDIETLPLAFQLKKPNTKVIFDAHEYAPLHFEDKLWWRIFFQGFNTFLCSKYIPKIDGMITIGQGLADEYEKNFGVKPIVMTNACGYHSLAPLASDAQIIRLVHIGIVNRSRKLELFIELANLLPDNFTLDLVLVMPPQASQQTKEYLQWLKNFAQSNKRVYFRDAVPVAEIVPLIQQYDMGIILAPPINFNYANGLPNKLFDYIQARIGVISWPTPEIAKIVKDYNIGIISDTFTTASLADKLRLLGRKEIQAFKMNTNRAAEELSAEKNEIKLNNLVDAVLQFAD
jgi:glycosyltransferase involved in cell wall biosynthesis